jgi:Tol biopolymer transport system component/predicted Ser/Thr protein kinase
LADVKDAPLECPACKTRIVVQGYDPLRSYRCPTCSNLLLTPSQAGETLVSPGVEERLPDEVRQALKDPRNRIGRFVLVNQVGAGGMGLVYRAWDEGLSRWVAVKFVRFEQGDAGSLARFKREAKVAAGLDHPNVAPVHEIGDAEGKHYLVMKFIDGATIDRAGFANVREVVAALREACRGVAHAHQAGIVHRDIKPRNIMIDRCGHAYVMDFGLAKPLGVPGVTFTDARLGTPTYMAPEQARGETKEVDARSDVFALGATLWELVAGRLPRSGGSLLDVLVSASRDPVPLLRSVRPEAPSGLCSVLANAMAMAKSERYASAAELGEALERCLASEGARLAELPAGAATLKAPSSTLPAAANPRCRQRKKVLAALVLAAAATSVLYVAFQKPAAPPPVSEAEKRYRAFLAEAEDAFGRQAWEASIEACRKALREKPGDATAEERLRDAERRTPAGLLAAARALTGERRWRSARETLSPLLLRDPVPEEAAALAASCIARGSRIVFTSNRDGNDEIYSMSPDGTGLKRLTDDSADDSTPSWSPDAGLLAFVTTRHGDREIYSMHADGTAGRRLTQHPESDEHPRWSPDGTRIAYQSWLGPEASEIVVRDADGTNPRTLTRGLGRAGSPTWSPDGRRIAFVANKEGHFELYAVDVDGTGLARLTETSVDNVSPAWSPDGRRIAYLSRLDANNYEIFSVSPDGASPAQLTVNVVLEGPPVWSPDARRIAFYSKRDGNLEIYVMNADGSAQTRLTRTTADNSGPAWSPDGRRIAFLSSRDGNYEIYAMNADGTGQTRLTDHPATDANPVWSGLRDE